MARLLVSVRNEIEARAALEGGAAIVDVKEPSRGSLGMAPCFTWRRVRRALPPSMILSVALGELPDWTYAQKAAVPSDCWSGIDYLKVGLAGSGPDWRDHWRDLRDQVDPSSGGSNRPGPPRWVAVVYLDWQVAQAPEPLAVIGEAAGIADCPGVLFDTWDKSRRVEIEPELEHWIGRAKGSSRFVALAGSLDESSIRRLRPMEPDIFAVRGAACRGGDRDGPIEVGRVARLVEAAGGPAT